MRNFFRFSLVSLIFAVLNITSCTQQNQTTHDIYEVQRRNMVRWDLKAQGIKSKRVLEAMSIVPRHLFLTKSHRREAYLDQDLPISTFLKTPRPYIVAKTIELLNLKGHEKVLEIGTGRGYQSALLGELAKEVYTIEIVPEVFREAEEILTKLNYKNVHCRLGDGYKGWPEEKPFHAILVMASAVHVPKPLLQQLKIGGRLVMPLGKDEDQKLVLYRKTSGGLKKETIMPIHLKPMEGKVTGRY